MQERGPQPSRARMLIRFGLDHRADDFEPSFSDDFVDSLSLGPDGVLYASNAFVLKDANYTAVHVSIDRRRNMDSDEKPRLDDQRGVSSRALCTKPERTWAHARLLGQDERE